MLKRFLSALLSNSRHKAHELTGQADRAFHAGAIEESIPLYQAALQIAPSLAEAHNNLGIALQFAGAADAARQAFEDAIAADPRHGEAHYNLALLAADLRQPELAENHLELAKNILGDTAAISAGYGRLAGFLGDTETAAKHFSTAWEADPTFREAADSYLLALAACDDIAPDYLAREHFRAGKMFDTSSLPQRSFANLDGDPDRPLAIGYLSPDFREHSVRYFFESLLAHHDRSRYRIICYNDTARQDAYTESVHTRADLWRECAGKPDEVLAQMVAADRTDILVELAGHTSGNRMSALAGRLAPIQISGLGYPSTTGVPNIDYKLSDPIADPPGADAYYSERLLRLPRTFWCYAPPPDCPPPAPAPHTARGTVTFGCFGNLAKIGSATLGAWQRILAAVPGSSLLIKSNSLGNAWCDRHFCKRLESAGFDLDRVSLSGPSSGKAFLQAYAKVDLILDTFPFNGGTTTAHALWMSVPVLTHAGNLLLSRMGASMLSACGHSELISDNWDDYVEKAIALGNNRVRLTELRASLRTEMTASPLCDGPAYVSNLETSYRKAWHDWCRKYNGGQS